MAVNITELEQSFLELAELLLQQMRALRVPLLIEKAVEFLPNGSTTRGPRTAPSYRLLADSVCRQVGFTSEPARAAVDKHVAAGIFKDFVPGEDGYRQKIWVLSRPILRAIEKRESLDVEASDLLDAYHPFRDAWSGDRIVSHILVPVLNIEGDRSINFTQVELSPFSRDQKNSVGRTFLHHQDLISISTVNRSTFQLRWRKSASQDEMGECEAKAEDEIKCAITALRLAGPGDVGAQAVLYDREESGLGVGFSTLDLRVSPLGRKYDLNSVTDSDLVAHYSAVRKIGSRDLSIALSRFNQAYSRESAEDKIIDLTIALESSLLKGIREELKYRLAIRGACLLASSDNPQQTFSLLRRTYDERSQIVHNGSHLSDRSLTSACEEVTRKIIRTYLARIERGESVDTINYDLDSRVVANLS
jgi:hypothetical protein